MLNNTKGREKLLVIWRKQFHRCPVCTDVITSETGFKVHTSDKDGKKYMVHPECHQFAHNLNLF